MRLLHRRGLAVRSLRSRAGRNFCQHRCFQFCTRPHLGHAGHLRQLWHRRRLGRTRHGRSSGCRRRLRSPRHLGRGHLRHLGRRRRWQSESLPFHLMALDHRHTQVLDMHGRHLACRRRHLSCNPRRRSRSCGGHRQNRRFFLKVIQEDRFLRRGVGDDARGRRVETKLPVARLPHARCGLRRRRPSRRLRLSRTVRARGRRRRWCWYLPHSGDKCSTVCQCAFACRQGY